jgi:hypothetical protein
MKLGFTVMIQKQSNNLFTVEEPTIAKSKNVKAGP